MENFEIIEDKKDLLVEAVAKDMEIVTKPVSAVGNFVKRMKGEEVVVEEKETSREIRILEKRMAKNKLKKENLQK